MQGRAGFGMAGQGRAGQGGSEHGRAVRVKAWPPLQESQANSHPGLSYSHPESATGVATGTSKHPPLQPPWPLQPLWPLHSTMTVRSATHPRMQPHIPCYSHTSPATATRPLLQPSQPLICWYLSATHIHRYRHTFTATAAHTPLPPAQSARPPLSMRTVTPARPSGYASAQPNCLTL